MFVTLLPLMSLAQVVSCVSLNSSNFNGTDIASGNTIWFNAHFTQIKNVPNCNTSPVNIYVTNSIITFQDPGSSTNYSLPAPDGIITFSPTATSASTVYSSGLNRWTTTIPCGNNSGNYSTDMFFSGFGFLVPAGGLKGGANPVNWQATFGGPSGVNISWQWSAAVYVNFPSNLNNLQVNPLHNGSTAAGAPTNPTYTDNNNVIGGARGGGSANVTGSWSSTKDAGTCENIVLPVTFSSFTASRNNTTVTVKWTTASEQNNQGFTVQRNTDGMWKNLSFVASKANGGNSTTALEYEYIDQNYTKGISQYRIQQLDNNGKMQYSTILAVRGDQQPAKLIVYPNPSADGKVNVVFDDVTTTRNVQVMDMAGRIIQQFKGITNNLLTIENLTSGFYTIKVTNQNNKISSVSKLIIK